MADKLQIGDPQTDSTIDNYYAEIAALLLLALAGRILKREYIKRHEAITLATIRAVYILAGGSETDARFRRWFKEQQAIVRKSSRALGDDVYNGRYSKQELDDKSMATLLGADGETQGVKLKQTAEDGKEKALRRLGLWTFALGLAHHKGNVYNPFNDRRGTWNLGNTEKHCSTCLEQDGQTRTAAEWANLAGAGIEPQGGGLECGGWACDCSITWE